MRVVATARAAAAAVYGAVLAAVASGAGSAATLVERRAYLVTAVCTCGNCHTPRDSAGKPMANMELVGSLDERPAPAALPLLRAVVAALLVHSTRRSGVWT